MDSAGFRGLLPGDLSAIAAPIRSGNHLPPTIRQKKIKRHRLAISCFSLGVNSFPEWFGAITNGVVGSPQSGIGCLSESSKRFPGGAGHHGDNNEDQDVEVCDGRRRAH
jgi:hypothetical protein